MSKSGYPVTAAIRLLRDKQIDFKPHLYKYEERGGSKRSAQSLNVSEHEVIKTLVMETDLRGPFLVLMHGDREVSTKQLARLLGAKQVAFCDVETAQKNTGYLVGGTSPFGTRKPLPVYVEKSIFDLPRIFINGGKRGFLVEMSPHDLKAALAVTEVEAAIKHQG